ncbi:hypothetical protein MS3_00000916 [Schistosoma haematobium]|uniref:Reverse transcriptase/retrotransposon-derived protein RNase H-like domain-containing protein n=1 Tax=Schistosoma haematobium TaxID=6185 RepID=A0A922S764_SCHHA|nr:hypothetical protein MS3_00000916 [Schistosoma haematobium]KAH9596390.1 hypothetical protein MS3_00000916 [Schistosoma haematobium]
MSNVVSGLKIAKVGRDDLILIIHGSYKVSHGQRLVALLRRLIEKNVTLNQNKSSFCVSSFECLGYLVDGNGFKPDMKRLAPLTNEPSVEHLTELCSLVGSPQHCSRFISGFCCCANCLLQILTSSSFKCGEEQKSCPRCLLTSLQSDGVIQTRSPSVNSVLITDASSVGYGVV